MMPDASVMRLSATQSRLSPASSMSAATTCAPSRANPSVLLAGTGARALQRAVHFARHRFGIANTALSGVLSIVAMISAEAADRLEEVIHPADR